MKKLFTVIFVFTILAFIDHPVKSAGKKNEKMRIVVMDLKPTAVPEKTAKTVSNMIRNDMINLGSFVVVERAQIDAILNEHALQSTGCTDQACTVEMGRLLSAQKMLVGEISTLGKGMMITVRIVDVEKGVSEYAASEKAESDEVLDKAVNAIAKKLVARIEGRGVGGAGPDDIPAGYYVRGLVPGWAQIYTGHYKHGAVFGLAFWGGAAWTAASIVRFNKSKSDYTGLAQGLPQNRYDSAYNKYKNDGKIARYSSIGLAAVYALNWFDIIYFTKPESGRRAGMFRYNNMYVNVSMDVRREYNNEPDPNAHFSCIYQF